MSVHLEAIMKTPEWQQRRSNVKALKYLAKNERYEKSMNPLEHRPKKLEHRKKYSRLIKPSTANALTASESLSQYLFIVECINKCMVCVLFRDYL